MKKDFKQGDKVTVISSGEVYCKGKINMVYKDAVCVDIDAYKSCTAHKSTVFHGHNVKVEITGEELPERLRMERVFLDTSLVKFLTPFCNGRQQCFIEMPAHIARQYREWMEENK